MVKEVKKMIVGTVKEVINSEFRVGLTPSSVKELILAGHEVFIEKDAGLNSGISNQDYIDAGATILNTAKEVWNKVELLMKVKEPQPEEYQYFKENLTIFSFMHLSAHKDLALALIENKTNAIAYETVETKSGILPCLKPMSDIAGRLGAIIGANYLQKTNGGSGVLLPGIPGVYRANVAIIGAGNVGINALKILVGLEANVTILDVDYDKLSHLDQLYGNKIQTLYSSESNLEKAITHADLVIGAVSLKGYKTPQLIKKSYYQKMRKGSVIIDVAIDQGGSTEFSQKTSHDDPIYIVDGIIHYAVPNIPGAVPLTATQALNDATIKYALYIANHGVKKAITTHHDLKKGFNIYNQQVVNQNIAETLELEYKPI